MNNSGCNLLREARTKAQESYLAGVIYSTCRVDLSRYPGSGRYTHEEAFQALKQALTTAPVLAMPDFQEPFIIETDASDREIGAVLHQEGHPIAYVSRELGSKNQGLSTYEKEYLAILLAVDHWRHYLIQAEFEIRTDQRSLAHLDDQLLHTSWQQKALTKLFGL